MKSLTVRIDDEIYMELDSFCKINGYTKNSLIKGLLVDFLDRIQKEEDGFSFEHPFWELVGKYKSGTKDVSSNKYKYLAEACTQK